MELDPWVHCPYDKIHRVPLSRLQAHIIKCEKNYPKLEICPYNATHRYTKEDIEEHIRLCPAKLAMFPEELPKATGALTTPKPILQKDYLPETDPNHEIWDQ
ncbi:gametocyte-specific factor 1-like [Pectinophora gossypiella]|uniref:gametocyte-specific factor 1-like n=1 Tax=Pectinophora gossypiella TaxID=13191 RepID=UPI00214ECF1C|nr:gametocyte-specific factor 1-like [Pectinophora gossypiella]